MAQPINLSKSMRRNRLFYKRTPGSIVDQVLNYAAIVMLFLCATLPLLVKPTRLYQLPVIHSVLILCFVSYLFLTVYLMNRLVKSKGINLYHNRKNIEEVLSEYFDQLRPEDCGKGVVRYVKHAGFVSWGRIITVLFDGNKVYLNITTLGRGDSVSIFHGLTNYIKCRQIIKKFKRMQAMPYG